jgi:hypothetical protein
MEEDLAGIIELANTFLATLLAVVTGIIAARYARRLNKAIIAILAAIVFLAIHELMGAVAKLGIIDMPEFYHELLETAVILSLLVAAYFGLKMKVLELET